MAEEARLTETPEGLVPASDGWFVLNVRDASWFRSERFGAAGRFENRDAPFSHLGINIRVLQPGQPNARYHSESTQEDFLVLAGECLLVVEGQERSLGAWDVVHCPPGTAHVFVGSGSGPCVILMVGARADNRSLLYPVSEVALRHGAGVESETTDPAQAYAGTLRAEPGRPPRWNELPWSRPVE